LRKLKAFLLLKMLNGRIYRRLGFGVAQAITIHRKLLSYYLDRDIVVNDLVFEKIVKSGRCMCRFTLCPCSYALPELKKYGRCKCGLFRLNPLFSSSKP